MAILFDGASAQRVELAGNVTNGVKPLLFLARFRADGVGGALTGRVFTNSDFSIQMWLQESTPGSLDKVVFQFFKTSSNHVITSDPFAAGAGTPQTVTLWRASTPDGAHKLWINDTELGYTETGDSGTYSTSSGSNFFIGNRSTLNRTFDGPIEYVAAWDNFTATDDQVRILSNGLRPDMLGTAPTIWVDFPGSVRVWSGQAVNDNSNDGFESGFGSYRIQPAQPIIVVPVGAAPTPVTADSLTTATFTLGQPALSQVHNAGADNLTAASPSLEEPALAQEQSLGADSLTTATFTLDEPAVTVVPSVPTLLRVEAESITALVNFSVQSNAAASGGQVIDLSGAPGGETGTATFDFPGVAGSYDIILGLFDENDGVATFSVSVEGSQVGSTITLDADTGTGGPTAPAFVTRTAATGIALSPGDEIVVTGTEEAGEFARFDYIEFVPSIAVTADDLTSETFTLGQPALSQVQDLGADGLIASAPILEAPALAQNQGITADDLTAATFTLDQPDLSQAQGLTANSLTAATCVLEQPALAQSQGLLVDDLTAAVPTLAQPSIAQNQSLTASPLTSATFELGEPVVTIVDGEIVVDGLTTATFTLGGPQLAQIQALPASPLTSAPFQLTPPILEQIQTLTANGLISETFTLGQPVALNVPVVVLATIQAASLFTPLKTASLYTPPKTSSLFTP
jgi:hypothetical protein